VEKFYTNMIQDSMGLGRTFIFKGNFGISDDYISLENDDHRDHLSVKEVHGEIPNQTYTRLSQDEIQALDLYNTIEDFLNNNKGE